jgi:hypothetical protein
MQDPRRPHFGLATFMKAQLKSFLFQAVLLIPEVYVCGVALSIELTSFYHGTFAIICITKLNRKSVSCFSWKRWSIRFRSVS